MMTNTLKLGLVCAAITLGAQAAAAMEVRVEMKDTAGNAVGTVTLTQAAADVVISADLNNLPAGAHGFHIHEKGSCAPDFKAAGGHFNPAGKEHGVNNPNGRHAGDLPNIHVNADGTARADFYTDAVSLKSDDPASLVASSGTAFIVHEKADSYAADPGAGGRIACGVISPISN